MFSPEFAFGSNSLQRQIFKGLKGVHTPHSPNTQASPKNNSKWYNELHTKIIIIIKTRALYTKINVKIELIHFKGNYIFYTTAICNWITTKRVYIATLNQKQLLNEKQPITLSCFSICNIFSCSLFVTSKSSCCIRVSFVVNRVWINKLHLKLEE